MMASLSLKGVTRSTETLVQLDLAGAKLSNSTNSGKQSQWRYLMSQVGKLHRSLV